MNRPFLGSAIRLHDGRVRSLLLICLVHLAFTGSARAEHPQVLVTNSDRNAVLSKIAHAAWAQKAFAKLKARVDKYVALSQQDPHFVSSRLFMNWSTHYTLPITEHERWVAGSGHAPVPTPRFAGARNWASPYTMPPQLEDYRAYNDNDGKVWMINTKTHQGEWIDPGLTGRTMELVNEQIEKLAADAGFLYWLTGDERYAKFAADILWTYMEGFSYVQPPQFPPQDSGTAKIIGMTSFEVIHENIMIPLSEAYDFLYDYLRKNGKDVNLIQLQLRRMADRVVAGGFKEGNWNLNEQLMITYAGLALESDQTYPDGHGRSYYINIVLNADTPVKLGLTKAIKVGYDQETALWPEAPGYGFGGSELIIEIASLLTKDPAGLALLDDPFLTRALLAQEELIYPNGWSVGVGDTDNTRLNTKALELLIAAARNRSNNNAEERLTAALQQQINNGFYDRSNQDDILALTHYVGDLKPVPADQALTDRTYFAKPLNIVMQRNLSDSVHSLAAALYGTAGGHVHANGMAIELYGADLILGADPGRGESYWQAENGEYYSQPPAHNTVIINGQSNYPAYGPDHVSLVPDSFEPAFGQEGVDENVSFVQASFRYKNPPADQQRTLALIRTGPTTGFYFDVFRSRADQEPGSFHDYLYHDIGQTIDVSDAQGKPLALAPSTLLQPKPNHLLVGYGYFKNEKSLDDDDNLSTTFTVSLPDGTKHLMNLWLGGEPDRRVFSVDAPADHAGRPALPKGMSDLPMPTLIVRQKGEAWNRPFVAVYEPYLGAEGSAIVSIHQAHPDQNDPGLAACVVENVDKSVYEVMQSADPHAMHHVDGCTFQGSFGMVAQRNGQPVELYLGEGESLSCTGLSLQSIDQTPVSASVRQESESWKYSATRPVRVSLNLPASIPNSAQFFLVDAHNQETPVKPEPKSTATPADGHLQNDTFLLPAKLDQTLHWK